MPTLFTLAALIGGTVLAFQFVVMLLGLSHDGDVSGVDGGDFSGGDHIPVGDHVHFGGTDGSGDLGADHTLGHDGASHPTHTHSHFYEMLSLRTVSAALTFFGLVGHTALAYGQSPLVSLVLGVLAGLAAMYVVYWLFKQVYRLQHTGTENIRNAIGASAEVYVPIPGKRAGAGKVMFRLQNRVVEYQAVTDDETRLATGEKVEIVGIVNSDTVRVARATAPAPELASSNMLT